MRNRDWSAGWCSSDLLRGGAGRQPGASAFPDFPRFLPASPFLSGSFLEVSGSLKFPAFRRMLRSIARTVAPPVAGRAGLTPAGPSRVRLVRLIVGYQSLSVRPSRALFRRGFGPRTEERRCGNERVET